jgi:hypothetical protein
MAIFLVFANLFGFAKKFWMKGRFVHGSAVIFAFRERFVMHIGFHESRVFHDSFEGFFPIS